MYMAAEESNYVIFNVLWAVVMFPLTLPPSGMLDIFSMFFFLHYLEVSSFMDWLVAICGSTVDLFVIIEIDDYSRPVDFMLTFMMCCTYCVIWYSQLKFSNRTEDFHFLLLLFHILTVKTIAKYQYVEFILFHYLRDNFMALLVLIFFVQLYQSLF